MMRSIFYACAAELVLCGPRTAFAADTGSGGGAPSDPAPAPVAAKPTSARGVAKPRAANKARPDADGLVEAVVKRGTLVVGDDEHVGPGGVVRLLPEDVARLQADGVLEDPETEQPPAFDGPQISRG